CRPVGSLPPSKPPPVRHRPGLCVVYIPPAPCASLPKTENGPLKSSTFHRWSNSLRGFKRSGRLSRAGRRRQHLALEALENRCLPATALVLNIDNTTLVEGQTVTLTGTITAPPDTPFTAEIAWGDGTLTQSIALDAGATTFTATHLYTDDKPTFTPQ